VSAIHEAPTVTAYFVVPDQRAADVQTVNENVTV
jgi:hypothetical protein